MKATKLVKEITQQKNIYAEIAVRYVNDEKLAHQFLLECFDDCQAHPVNNVFNKTLTAKIILYGQKHLN